MIDGSAIDRNIKEVLFRITTDRELKFYDHVNSLCKKLNALVQLAIFVNVIKRTIILKTFIESQFGYCPLVWMFNSQSFSNKIIRIHERTLTITYNGKSL